MSRIPTFSGVNLDLSGPLGQRAEAARVGGQLLSAKTPEEAQSFLGGAYQAADTSALAFNNALFNATQGGYQNLLADQTSAQNAIAQGYTDLASLARQRQQGLAGGYDTLRGHQQAGSAGIAGGYGALQRDVLADIEGIGRTRSMDINDAYQRNLGAMKQNLISAGLGNSTVLAAMSRGAMTDAQRAQIANDESVANLRAGYRSRLGQAGLDFRERALGQDVGLGREGLGYRERALGQELAQGNLGLSYDQEALGQRSATAQRQLDWMNTIQAPYPDAGMYAALAQQYGAQKQAGADRAALQGIAAQQAQLAARPLPGGDGGAGAGGAPAFGGGFARAPSLGQLAPPQGGAVGQSVLAGAGGPSLGAGAFGSSSGSVSAPALVGAGGGFSGGAYIAPGVPLEAAGAYTGYGGQSVAGSGFGGGFGSTGDASAGVSGGGAYQPYGGFGGGFGGGAYGGYAADDVDDWAEDYVGGMFGF